MTPQAVTIGPPLEALRDQAERAVDMHFAQTSPRLALAGEDAATIAAAWRVAGGGEPPEAFMAEAAMRGLSAEALAERVLALAEETLQRKLRRVTIKAAVRAATTHAAIAAALASAGIALPR